MGSSKLVTNFDRPSELNPNIQQTNDSSLRLPSDSLQKWTLKWSCPNIKSSNLQISHNFLISPAHRNAPRLRVSDLLRWTDWWALALHEALTEVAMFPSERGVEHADLEDGIFASVFFKRFIGTPPAALHSIGGIWKVSRNHHFCHWFILILCANLFEGKPVARGGRKKTWPLHPALARCHARPVSSSADTSWPTGNSWLPNRWPNTPKGSLVGGLFSISPENCGLVEKHCPDYPIQSQRNWNSMPMQFPGRSRNNCSDKVSSGQIIFFG